MKPLFFIFLIIITTHSHAQDFRGEVHTKMYNENGKLYLPSMNPEVTEDGELLYLDLEVDTFYSTYSICGDTVFQFSHYGDYITKNSTAQLGKEFYILNTKEGYYFKFKSAPHPLETFSTSDWKKSIRKYRKRGLDYTAIYKKDTNFKYYADIDTAYIVYNRHGHTQGLLNYLFPEIGLFEKVVYDFKEESRATEYFYEPSEVFSCDELMENFVLKDTDVTEVEDFFKSTEIDFSIALKGARKSFGFFEINNHLSQPVRIADFQGSYVYVDVWASWCAPCIGEMPYLKKIRQHYDPEQLRVLSISLDEKKEMGNWLKAIERLGLTWDNWRVDGKFSGPFCSKYNIKAIPRYLVIDSDGKVVNSNAPRPSNDHIISWLDSIILDE